MNKNSSQKIQKKKHKKIVMVSGGFDPVHIGHVRLFKAAKNLGDELVVVLNNDNWLEAKKGKKFMPAVDRKEIIKAFACVDRVVISSHSKHPKGPEEMSVCRELVKIRPNIFANGGDRNTKDANNPNSSLYWEKQIHKKFGIQMVHNVGKGGKIRSSSELLKKYSDKNKK